MIEAVLSFLAHPLATATGGFIVGSVFVFRYINWRYGVPVTQTDLVETSIGHAMLADESLRLLTDDQQRTVEANVDERMKEHFGPDASFTLPEGRYE
jgi:hypothetical protein